MGGWLTHLRGRRGRRGGVHGRRGVPEWRPPPVGHITREAGGHARLGARHRRWPRRRTSGRGAPVGQGWRWPIAGATSREQGSQFRPPIVLCEVRPWRTRPRPRDSEEGYGYDPFCTAGNGCCPGLRPRGHVRLTDSPDGRGRNSRAARPQRAPHRVGASDPTTAAWQSALTSEGVAFTSVTASGAYGAETVTLPTLTHRVGGQLQRRGPGRLAVGVRRRSARRPGLL